MYDHFETPEPDEAVKLALRRIEESTARGEGSDVAGLEFNEVVVNMGPQHPSTHGVLRLVVTLDGELVKDVIPVIGYLHRCKEKIAERRTYFQYIPILDRTEYVAGINCEWAYVLAVEKLAGIRPTRRAEFIRVITAELMRIASHLVAVGTFTADLSPLGTAMVFYMFRDREDVLDLMEELTGARMMFNYFRFGGVRYDLPDGWVEKCRDFVRTFPAKIREYEALVDDNAIFLQRTQGKGVITQQDVVDYGITGPNARASGIPLDLRRTRPYSVYPELDFDVCVEHHGDVFDRYRVRIREMRESLKIIEQCLDMLPRGPVQVGSLRAPYVITPPPGSCYVGQENPRGEFGTYIESDGSRYPYRLKYRDPCFCNLQLFPKLLSGNKIADAVAISGSIDLVLGGIDR
ncbi:MAG TPA: NADH-quinone oxidoreductase subunit D [Thermoleophilia bacterium]|jgi:NADH-quinone oxidoreductase subunit D|nr:NADH-quinone oxidoreductase subunit D [Actinomycetota bacterium]OPZ46051.1 MAG: NAD(P)H-quinone oxidoreductase subunit H [Actinobacteria bacterium ADurb.BinA094]HQH21852.1 NADH-quinone oxidoreductase subunit D [Thermoleophilia bacterium]HQJ26808.1 NADH-quinone oxidoreductase subunit D [Thermoleophilia bacterium]